MFMGYLSASKEERLQTRKWCSYTVNLEVERAAKFQLSVWRVLSTCVCPALSLLIACPKSPRGQNREDRDSVRNPVGLVVWVMPAGCTGISNTSNCTV